MTDELPGTPFPVKLKCPACGWTFDFGLRRIAELETGDETERCVTCCSKCLSTIDFKVDGSEPRVVTPEMMAAYSPELQMAIHKGHFLAWLAEQVSKGPPQ